MTIEDVKRKMNRLKEREEEHQQQQQKETRVAWSESMLMASEDALGKLRRAEDQVRLEAARVAVDLQKLNAMFGSLRLERDELVLRLEEKERDLERAAQGFQNEAAVE